MLLDENLKDKIRNITDMADGLLITAGAGMGVDSGLPDFRGKTGFWQAYPALKQSGIDFYDIASPAAFISNPRQAWGFYGHRLNLYRKTIPNAGFDILKKLAIQMPNGAFVYTSNVDGQFQKAGFSEAKIVECHGSIHHMQCINGCLNEITSAKDFEPVTNDIKCQLVSALPQCIYCGEVSRPNILMFNDFKWLGARRKAQEEKFKAWLANVNRLVVIEIGAGTSIPTVREFGEHQAGYLIRINPNEAELPSSVKGIGLKMTGFAGLQFLMEVLG